MKNIVKENKIKIILAILYLIVILPMCYCIYYSVPLADDFAAATRNDGVGVWATSLRYGFGMWRTWGGRWLDYLVQVWFNPLNAHTHLGHVYGVILIGIFLVTTAFLIYAIKVIVDHCLEIANKKLVSIATFLTVAILYTSYYYSEVFNWYVGTIAYQFPVVLTIVTIALMIRYTENGLKNKHYILLILAGILPAVNEFCDIALGLAYLYLIYFLHIDERKNESKSAKIKNTIPLLIYVAFGCSVVFAPGNFIRSAYYGIELSITSSLKQLIIDIVVRVQDLIVDHPLSVLIFLNLILIGIISNNEQKKPMHICLKVLLMALILFGSVFPYIYGRGFTTTYVDVRMQYVLDYCIEISISLVCIMLGKWMAYKFSLQLTTQNKLSVFSTLALFAYLSIIQNYAYLDIVQVDILRHHSLITESYALWDGILAEIEASTDDDVVIHRDHEMDWTPYFLYTGLTDGDTYSVSFDKIYDEDQIMPNVYYGKNSITLYYDN